MAALLDRHDRGGNGIRADSGSLGDGLAPPKGPGQASAVSTLQARAGFPDDDRSQPPIALLSTMPVGRGERRLALAVVLISVLGFAAAAPFARLPLPKSNAFIPSYESALVIIDLITAALLFGQFSRRQSYALLALASGYLFDALIIIPHALTFPGVFSETGLLGAGNQTTAWLYVFWHGGFPLFVLAYAVLANRDRSSDALRGRTSVAVAVTTGGIFSIVCGLTALATAGHDFLPVVIRGGDFTLLVTKGVSPTLWVLSLLALAALWRRRKPSVLDLWLMVVMCAWLLDIGLSAIIGSSRYDLGWYGGRTYGLLAASFVLVVLLVETSGLHGRLAEAKHQLEHYALRLEERVRERTAALEAEATRRGQAEAQLHQAQKMEAIGNLTGGMAHDFNNLLGVIIGNLDIVLDAQRQDGTNEELSAALSAAWKGADLTRSLLAFARRQPLEPKRVALNDLVGNTTKLLGRTLGENIGITLDLSADAWPVIADPAQLEASLVNLATNARDAMPAGGRLQIATGNRHLDADYAAQHQDVVPGDYALIEVADDGKGIPRQMLGRIFEPFFTTKELGKGTGLGLSMVFGFMKQSGGHINVYSEEGVGTTFRLYLPRATEDSTGANAPPSEQLPGTNGEAILLVEDNTELRRVAVRQLLDLGYRVLQAGDVATALRALEHEAVDLVLTDLMLPGGRSGYDLVRAVLDRRPATRIVLMSGFPDAMLPGGTGERPAYPLVCKPFRKADLARTLRAAFDNGHGAA